MGQESQGPLCIFSLPHLKMAPSQTLLLKPGCHLARSRSVSLHPFLEPCFRDFAQEYRQALRMESSKALLKGNSSLRKILRKNEDLGGKQLRGGPQFHEIYKLNHRSTSYQREPGKETAKLSPPGITVNLISGLKYDPSKRVQIQLNQTVQKRKSQRIVKNNQQAISGI